MNTTLNEIRKYGPCESGWSKLLTYLNKTKADDEPLSFITILESNGIMDASWCLRVLPSYDLKVMEFKLKCARRVEHLDGSREAKRTLDIVEKFINGDSSIKDLRKAADAAYDAAADAAAAAAYDAAAYDAAAYVAAAAAADAAAAAAYDAAAYDAAYVAAAYDAERDYQTEIFREIFK